MLVNKCESKQKLFNLAIFICLNISYKHLSLNKITLIRLKYLTAWMNRIGGWIQKLFEELVTIKKVQVTMTSCFLNLYFQSYNLQSYTEPQKKKGLNVSSFKVLIIFCFVTCTFRHGQQRPVKIYILNPMIYVTSFSSISY